MMDAIIPIFQSRDSKKGPRFLSFFLARPGCWDDARMVQNAYMRPRRWWATAWDGTGMTISQLGMPWDASGPSKPVAQEALSNFWDDARMTTNRAKAIIPMKSPSSRPDAREPARGGSHGVRSPDFFPAN